MRLLSAGPSEPAAGAGLLVLRLVFGLTLLVNHGWGKLTGAAGYFWEGAPWRFVDGVTAMGFPLPAFFATAAALSETVAALFLVVGLATRPAAVLVAVTMIVACCSHVSRGEYPEMASLYLAAALALLITGAGRYSLDAILTGDKA